MLNDPAALSSVAVWSLNIVSSLGVIFASKTVLKTLSFPFATTLTAWHFCVTASAGLLAQHAGLLSPKTVPWGSIFWFSLVANVSIVASNFSLLYNSVGFYQIAKLSIIPTSCLVQWMINGRTISKAVAVSIVVVIAGVAVCTVTDVSVSPFGLMMAFLAIITTALQQVYVEQLQRVHAVGSFDLLSLTAPVQAVSLTLAGPLVDFILTKHNVLLYQVPVMIIPALIMSATCALFLNLSSYLCIGKFSAVTFQVMGNMKTVLIIVMGMILFDSPVTMKNFLGLLLAIMGMVLYSWAVEAERVPESPQASQSKPQDIANQDGLPEESTPLKERVVLREEFEEDLSEPERVS